MDELKEDQEKAAEVYERANRFFANLRAEPFGKALDKDDG